MKRIKIRLRGYDFMQRGDIKLDSKNEDFTGKVNPSEIEIIYLYHENVVKCI